MSCNVSNHEMLATSTSKIVNNPEMGGDRHSVLIDFYQETRVGLLIGNAVIFLQPKYFFILTSKQLEIL
jgi:hypothetical protein